MHEIISHSPSFADFDQVKCVKGFETIHADYAVYLTDESKLSAKPFDYLFFPKNEADLSAVIQEMSRRNTAITIASARTGLVGGCVPQRGALVSMELFDRVQAVYFSAAYDEWRVCAQANVSLKTLDSMLRIKQFPELESGEIDPDIKQHYEQFKQDTDFYFYPPDPTEMSASLGGTVITNASGARTYRYGPTRSWVRSIRVFLADGEYLNIPRGKYFASPAGQFVVWNSAGQPRTISIPDYAMPMTKSTTGFYTAPYMDLIDLFIGSEGVLGVITQVEVALLKKEPKISIVQFLESDRQAVELAVKLRADSRLQLDFLEFYSGSALSLLRELQKSEPSVVGMPLLPNTAKSAIFFEMNFDPHAEFEPYNVLDEIMTSVGVDLSNSWAGYERRELDRFKVFRHMVPETINGIIAERKKAHPGIHKLGTDLAVPDSYLEEIWQLYASECNRLELDWYAFGHIGNNHIHVNILPRNMDDLEKGMKLYEVFASRAVEMGGAISAEHGIGKIKGKFLPLMFTPNQIQQMRNVKKALDPQGILNPDNIFPLEVHQ